MRVEAGAKTIKRDAVAKTGFDVIINATPAGMLGNKTTALLGPEDLNCRLVFDLVYNPIETPLLRMARQKGIAVITGVEMFVQQGARQFEIWTGKPAPDQEMLKVVVHSLRQGMEEATGAIDPGAAAPKLDRVAEPVTEPEPQPLAAPVKAVAAKVAPAAKLVAAKAVPAKAIAPVKPVVATKKVVAAPAKKAVPAKKVVPAKKGPPVKKAAAKPVAKKIVAKSKPAAKPAAKKAAAKQPAKKR